MATPLTAEQKQELVEAIEALRASNSSLKKPEDLLEQLIETRRGRTAEDVEARLRFLARTGYPTFRGEGGGTLERGDGRGTANL